MWGNRTAPKHRGDGRRVRSREVRQGASQGTPLLVDGDSWHLVVGGEFHPDAYRDARVGDTVSADLVPEPSNPYDAPAVAVVIGNETAGYLNIGCAQQYVALIQQANGLGYRVRARGEYEHGASSITVRLNLPWPDDLRKWLDLPAERRAGRVSDLDELLNG